MCTCKLQLLFLHNHSILRNTIDYNYIQLTWNTRGSVANKEIFVKEYQLATNKVIKVVLSYLLLPIVTIVIADERNEIQHFPLLMPDVQPTEVSISYILAIS